MTWKYQGEDSGEDKIYDLAIPTRVRIHPHLVKSNDSGSCVDEHPLRLLATSEGVRQSVLFGYLLPVPIKDPLGSFQLKRPRRQRKTPRTFKGIEDKTIAFTYKVRHLVIDLGKIGDDGGAADGMSSRQIPLQNL